MGELTKTDNAGKNSPGPVYMFSDIVKYDQVGIFRIYTLQRRSYKIFVMNKLNLFFDLHRLQDGHSVLKFVLEKISQNMISMKMLFS